MSRQYTRIPGGRVAALICPALIAAAVLAVAATAQVDLMPMSLTRLEGGAGSPPPTPVRVEIVVRNISGADMPAAQAEGGWLVQVQGHSGEPLRVQRALRAGEEHRLTLVVVVPCGKVTRLEVRVNANRGVRESNFDNNRARFPVQGNACPIAIRAGALMRGPGTLRASRSRRHLRRHVHLRSRPPLPNPVQP